MGDLDDAPAEGVIEAPRPTSEELFGAFGLNVATLYEYETPFDPLAALDGD